MGFTKNDAYYAQLDKRTKEYKEYKAFKEEQSLGLGDDIANITKATGLDKVANSIAKAFGYDDCGCEARKERINKLFRYERPDCLTEDEFVYLSEFFDKSRTRVSIKEQRELLAIFNRVFRTNEQPTNCSSCYLDREKKLRVLIKEHKK